MKQSKRYKVIKKILGGVTHDVVYKVGDTVNENIFNGMLTGFLIANGFLEPIPETPQMEIVEGTSEFDTNGVTYFYPLTDTKVDDEFTKSILITNYTPEMKQIIEAVKNKKVYERWVDRVISDKINFNLLQFHVTSTVNIKNKILIIPIEEENNG